MGNAVTAAIAVAVAAAVAAVDSDAVKQQSMRGSGSSCSR